MTFYRTCDVIAATPKEQVAGAESLGYLCIMQRGGGTVVVCLLLFSVVSVAAS